MEKLRAGGRVVNKALVIAHGVHETGRREILSSDVGVAETEAFWTAFLRGLVNRGLVGVQLAISDAHAGLKAAIGKVPGWRPPVSGAALPRISFATRTPSSSPTRAYASWSSSGSSATATSGSRPFTCRASTTPRSSKPCTPAERRWFPSMSRSAADPARPLLAHSTLGASIQGGAPVTLLTMWRGKAIESARR
jgi:hypothetical protein